MQRLPSSFRDPAGFVFEQDGELRRQILPDGRVGFKRLVRSGLAERLMQEGKLAGFEPCGENDLGPILRLQRLPFISYPYEWSFSQLRDAALLTLELMEAALEQGMILKDATAFNVAFRNCRPVFLDHTSFELHRDGEPWRAYRQFAMHFIAPLLLMKHVDLRCIALLRKSLDGIPLDFASAMLPWHTWLRPNALLHVHAHAIMERRLSSEHTRQRTVQIPRKRLQALVHGLREWLGALRPPRQATLWKDYYQDNSYSDRSFAFKQDAVRAFCELHPGDDCIDLGANAGVFSRIAAEHSSRVVAADYDACSVEALYHLGREMRQDLQPLLLDLNNPSPETGVLCRERQSFFQRTRATRVLGLALIHHLRITGNWSISQIVALFDALAPAALVEFVPLDDIQVRQLTRGREEIYRDWTLDNLCDAFRAKYPSCVPTPIPDTRRVLLDLSR